MRRFRLILSLLLVAAATAVFLPAPVSAQDTPLPPALQAALLSGSAARMNQALQTLSGGNPQREAALAVQLVSAAEKMLATNPEGAIQGAAGALQAVHNLPVVTGAPAETLQVITTAARILVSPLAQQVQPALVGQLAVAVVQLASVPAVYQAGPAAAIQVMANAYTAASSQTVAAETPTSLTTVTQLLNQASNDPNLTKYNTTNPAQIAAILAKDQGNGDKQLPGVQNVPDSTFNLASGS